MADKQFGVSPAEQRNFAEKQQQRLALREQYLKHITNPHRHGTGEGGHLFDAGLFRFSAMRAKEYDHFRPTAKSGFQGFCIVLLPLLIAGWLIKSDREAKELSFRSGEVAYKDRLFKLV